MSNKTWIALDSSVVSFRGNGKTWQSLTTAVFNEPHDSGEGNANVSPTIITTSLQNGNVNVYYSANVTGSGDEPLTWSISANSLPSWANLSSNTGNTVSIIGTPDTPDITYFTIKLENPFGFDEQELSILVPNSIDGNSEIDPQPDATIIKRWNGSAWDNLFVKYYSGNSWVAASIQQWNGTSWEMLQ